MSETLENDTTNLEADMANSALQYMSTDDGKRCILNPKGRTPILHFQHWKEATYKMEIKSRMFKYVKEIIQKDDFVAANRKIQQKVFLFYKHTCAELDGNDIGDELNSQKEICTEIPAQTETHSYVLAASVFLAAFYSLSASFVLGGLYILAFDKSEARRNEIINKTYDKYKEAIFEVLKKNSCHVLRKVINKVMNDLLARRLNSFEERVRQLREIHKDVLNKQDLLRKLNEQVQLMKGRVIKLQESLNPSDVETI